jgi:hypothetical protein
MTAPTIALVLLLLQAQHAPTPAAPNPADQADLAPRSKAAFEKLKTLEGQWRGQSTKGWTDSGDYKVIAGGSVIMHTSFDAHPNETMITMFHLDGDRLLLTHYCVAKNQPRLVATEISPDLNRMVFTFLDITGVPSRDQGHMDQCVFEFESDARFTSQWTWYQKGKESWMEKIINERLPAPAATPAVAPGAGNAAVAPCHTP